MPGSLADSLPALVVPDALVVAVTVPAVVVAGSPPLVPPVELTPSVPSEVPSVLVLLSMLAVSESLGFESHPSASAATRLRQEKL
ncbi:hypothetical protein [Nannocystis pusilla]|uniref:hypothetical protein n=1 Tax=Nannocystis pusilla TaxID=889268 RepID=UPI003B7FC440